MTITLDKTSRAPGRASERVADCDRLRRLWSEYKTTGSVDLRNQLTVHYAFLAKFVAFRALSGAPSHIDRGDLVSYGILGLIDAIERFDPLRPVRFEAYALRRIRGAVMDELRRVDWTPRSVRRKARAAETAVSDLEATLSRRPTDDEVAQELQVSLRDYRATLRDVHMASVCALETTVSSASESPSPTNEPRDLSWGPEVLVETKMVRDTLSEALRDIDQRERTLLTLYYFENLTLAEVGHVLGVSEGRVCQLHARAVSSLRKRMQGLGAKAA